MPDWEINRSPEPGNLSKFGSSFGLDSVATPRLKHTFEPKGDSVFETSAGYVAFALLEGARPFLLEIVAIDEEPSHKFLESVSQDFPVFRFADTLGKAHLLVGIQKNSEAWHMPLRPRWWFEKAKKLWAKYKYPHV